MSAPVQQVWALECANLRADIAENVSTFAADFVSFTPDGDQIGRDEFSQVLAHGTKAHEPVFLWGEVGSNQSICLAFRLPGSTMSETHLSLWSKKSEGWRKQFHIFVDGEKNS